MSNQQMTLVNSNYYYSSVGNTTNEQYTQPPSSNIAHQSTYHQHAPSNLSHKSGGAQPQKQNGNQSTSNAMAAMQAYASGTTGGIYQVNNKTISNAQRKTSSGDQLQQQQLQQHQFSPPSNSVSSSSTSAIMTQILMGAHKKSIVASNTSNLNRYESLQSKLKNKRRQQPAGNLICSNSSQNIGPQVPNSTGKNIQASGDQKFNQTQKFSITGYIGSNQVQNNGQLSNRKQLKISVDQHSDSSFNNISIKSADKQNSVVRQIAAGILSHKNNTQTLNMKELSNQISPSSNNAGSILQNFNSSQNSVYSSNFSNNSRFNNRPKNPTESSSLSSKNSESLNSHAVLANANQKSVLADLKKNLINKAQQNQQLATQQQLYPQQSSKQTAIQMIKEQQQMLIKQHQQSDSISDANLSGGVNGGSFSSSHSQGAANEAVQQKPLQTKLYSNINTKIQQSQQQLKGSNSIANLSKIGQQIQITSQNHIPATPGYKSKFTLMSRVAEKPHVMESTSKNSNNGGDSYRRHTEISKKKTSVSKTSGINCGAPFSPKQSNIVSSKIAALQKSNPQQQVYLSNLPQGYRNIGGLTIKASVGGASIGSTHSKKSGREQNKTQDIVKNPSLNQSSSASFKPKLVKQEIHQQKYNEDQLMNQMQVTAQLVGIPQAKLNMEQIQSLLKQQQNHLQQQNLYKVGSNQAEIIQEERFEDSEQNTKRESTTNNNKQSNPNLIAASLQDLQIQQQLSNATSHSYLNGAQKSKSLLTINLEQTQSIKRLDDPQIMAPPPAQTTHFEEIKQNSTLQAMKEKLKAQISLQHHPFSNPNQPSSQIEVAEAVEPIQPINAVQALNLYLNNLNEYERTEILGYNEIYYLGLVANLNKIKGSSKMPNNYGYDDERGDYTVVLQDHLCYRYQILDFLGKGSFGQALKCKDHKTNEIVAAKIIRNKKRFQHQAGIELSILNYLKQNDPDDVNNIIRVKEYFIFRKHLVITFELLSINLYEFIKNNNFNGVSLSLIRRFAIQILQALKYQREHGIIHCDLKPENILLKQPNKSGIKIIDYGSSCFQNQRIYTYIQSRFYRAPEIVMGIPYTTSIDMWSFGCILAELFKGYPLFPGENEMEQLAYIMEIKGVPEDYLLELSSRRKLFFDTENQPIIVANSKGKKRRPLTKTLKAVLKCTDQNFIDFLDQCLDWDPVRRMTPLEALQHPWILEGLPEKVLMHHQRMFGSKDDKNNIKEATLTAIQGFPPDAENNTIFEQFKQRPLQEIDLSELTQHYGKQQLNKALPSEEEEEESKQDNHQTANFQNQQQSSSQAAIGNSVRQKQAHGSKTIQNLMQELVEEKQQKSGKLASKISVTNPLELNNSYTKNNFNYMQIVEVDTGSISTNIRNQNPAMAQSSSIIPENNEDDIEEGVNFNKTQKIPISLIKQQEKIPIHQQVPFYNPKISGPKLNNYISQAATAINKKSHHAASTSNLNISGQNRGSGVGGGQTATKVTGTQVNYSMNNNNINHGQLTNNSSMVQSHNKNNPIMTNGSSIGTLSANQYIGQDASGTNNISFQQPYNASETNNVMSQHHPLSARSGKNNKPNVSQVAAATISSYGQYQKMSANYHQNTGKYKLAQAIKVDLEKSSSAHHNHQVHGIGGGPNEHHHHPPTNNLEISVNAVGLSAANEEEKKSYRTKQSQN